LEFNDEIDEIFLLERFNSIFNEFLKKGLDKELILDNLILSPACGLGNLEEVKSKMILELLSKISYQFSK
jgi:hypothetical protein